ncbi:voltage-dependent calcium channel gamma-7 subunit-like [Tachypleus tridentatus]|uniref:voltage-dependent calcium channel gamma-7 subunit-like n=1 Tax=Tachypleus tridentatus TaxID=6853 RepID=UPI003FD33407
MSCTTKNLSIYSLFCGSISLVALVAGLATDYWTFTTEPLAVEEPSNSTSVVRYPVPVPPSIVLRVGFWRCCTVEEHSKKNRSTVLDMPPATCYTVPYFQEDPVDIFSVFPLTGAVIERTKMCVPFLAGSLLVVFFATTCAWPGHRHRDVRTLIASVLYIISGLSLGGGMVLYMSLISEEYGNKGGKYPDDESAALVTYVFGWSFYLAACSFVAAEGAAVLCISVYIRRFPNLIIAEFHLQMNEERPSDNRNDIQQFEYSEGKPTIAEGATREPSGAYSVAV